jgi:hypothetical protein
MPATMIDLQVTAILKDGSWTWRYVRTLKGALKLARRWRVENGWRTWIEDGNMPGNLPHIEMWWQWYAWHEQPRSRRLQ